MWCFPACTGVEGFANSAIQCELLARPTRADVTVVVVHAVNPSGMAWWRRQNENNVDLNRNCWWDFAVAPPNPGYAEVHDLLMPAPPSCRRPSRSLRASRRCANAMGSPGCATRAVAGSTTIRTGCTSAIIARRPRFASSETSLVPSWQAPSSSSRSICIPATGRVGAAGAGPWPPRPRSDADRSRRILTVRTASALVAGRGAPARVAAPAR